MLMLNLQLLMLMLLRLQLHMFILFALQLLTLMLLLIHPNSTRSKLTGRVSMRSALQVLKEMDSRSWNH